MDISSKKTLSKKYFLQSDVVFLAKDLIGKVLFSSIDGKTTAVIITETEAYAGIEDKASHAYGNRRTKRTETMYAEGGIAYIYLIYGIHHLFNVVTNQKDIPHAVLIRGGYPIIGWKNIQARSTSKKLNEHSLVGPGRLSKLLGITRNLDFAVLEKKNKNGIWIEDWGLTSNLIDQIETTKRIGIDYAEEDADLPYRFNLPLKSPKILAFLKQICEPIDH